MVHDIKTNTKQVPEDSTITEQSGHASGDLRKMTLQLPMKQNAYIWTLD